MTSKKALAECLATFFYIGRIKWAPGTFGSLAAFPIAYILLYFLFSNQVIFDFDGLTLVESQILTILIVMLSLTFLLFILGLYFTSIYIGSDQNQDPKEVVIDEVVGQLLVLSLSYFSLVIAGQSNLSDYFNHELINLLFLFVMPFGLFRFFDIIKPWPINWLDQNIKGSMGIMLDDVAAGLFASVMHYAITFAMINFVG